MSNRPAEMTLSEKIKALVTSKATDEDRLQVLLHLTAELAERVAELERHSHTHFQAQDDIHSLPARAPLVTDVQENLA